MVGICHGGNTPVGHQSCNQQTASNENTCISASSFNSMGQFFMMKYVFFYGITRPFMKVDGIEPPDHPKCIGRIHLYSDMWRYFDAGLHKFMHR